MPAAKQYDVRVKYWFRYINIPKQQLHQTFLFLFSQLLVISITMLA